MRIWINHVALDPMSANKKALDLLVSSLEKGATGSSGKWELLGSTLQSGSLYNKSADDVLSLLKSSNTLEVCLLHLLNDVIHGSSVEQLRELCPKWVEYLTQQLQKAGDTVAVQSACNCLSVLLDRCHGLSRGMSEFTSRQLPAIMTSLIWFNTADVSLQCAVLPVVAKCVVYYPKPCSQFKTQLTKWGNSGLFQSSQKLSKECSRLLVLVQGSSTLIEAVAEQLHIALTILYGEDNQIPNMTIEVPVPPPEEPGRTAMLLQVVCVLSRTLCYCLLFPSSTGGSVPVERVVGVAVGGLNLKQQQVTGLSYDKLLLYSILPTVHASLFKLLTTIINACHAHLLSYTTAIEACIVQTMTSNHESESLTVSVHRCLCAWVSLRKDTDKYFITLTTSTLLKAVDSATTTPLCVQLSALESLSVIVRTVGVLLPLQICDPLSKLAIKGFSLRVPPEKAVSSLDLLLACVTSSNTYLHPNVGAALGMFGMGTRHQSVKVREFCGSALAQCELIRHPAVPPILSPPSKEASSVPLSGYHSTPFYPLQPIPPIVITSRELSSRKSTPAFTPEPVEPTGAIATQPTRATPNERDVPMDTDAIFSKKPSKSSPIQNVDVSLLISDDDDDPGNEGMPIPVSDDEDFKLFVPAPPDDMQQ